MSQKMRLVDIFEDKQYRKSILTTSIALFILLEFLIYLFAAIQGGDQSRVIITDDHGNAVYETSGDALTSYEKLVFENTFGPLKDYNVNVKTEHLPFPFRGWLAAAVGLPLGITLLVVFIVRVYFALMYGEEETVGSDGGMPNPPPEAKGFQSVFYSFERFSIYHIGLLGVLVVLVVWLIPNLLGDFAKAGAGFIREFKWFFVGVFSFLAGLIVWVIHLRYRLSEKMMESQTELEKMRIERDYLMLPPDSHPLLPRSSPDIEGEQSESRAEH